MKQFKSIISGIACLILCTGCTNLQRFFENPNDKIVVVEKEIHHDRETITIPENDATTDLPDDNVSETINTSKNTTVSKDSKASEDTNKSETTIKQTSSKIEHGALLGDWAIEMVNSKPAKGEYPPYIKFNPNENIIYGNNGCNVINATYKYNQNDSTLSFNNVIATTKACAMEDLTEYDINQALNNTRFYSWHYDNNQHYLEFLDINRNTLMLLMHQDFDFLNGAWHVTEIDGMPIDDDNMQLVFDIDERKVHGNTGCNILNGTLETDLETANTLSFQKIITTRMACPDASNETSLLVALEEVEYLKPIEKNKVVLLNNRREIVLQLTRIDVATSVKQ